MHILLKIYIFPNDNKQNTLHIIHNKNVTWIFREIERLMEYIPIEIDTYEIGKLANNTFIDSRYNFKDTDRIATRLGILEIGSNTVSVRDIIKLLNKFLKDAEIEELVESPRCYREI